MRIRSCLILALLATGVTRVGIAHAQDACGEVLTAPPIGEWAEYQVSKEGEAELELRFAIVGDEQRGGKDLRWFEMAITPEEEDDRTIMKVLVPGYPFEPDGIEEVVIKSGDSPAMKMGGPMLATIRSSIGENPGISILEQCQKMESVGEESVTVAAGTFQTRHFRDSESGGEIWLTKELPFGMVKSTDGDEYTIELIGHGDGAQTGITETPQDLFGGP